MIKVFYIFLLLAFYNSGYSQTDITWKQLKMKDYKEVENPENNSTTSAPVFSEVVEKLEGELVKISGLLITDTPKNSSMCNPSPDEIIEVRSPKRVKIVTQKPYTIQGKLKLNSTDPLSLSYIIENSNIIK